MKSGSIRALAVSTASLSLIASPALAEKADRLTSLNGLEAAGAESALQSRGFTYITSNTNNMGYTYSYWWDDDDDDCVRVEAYSGRVESIVDASDSDCNHSGDGDAAAAVGIIAGAAILGAILSHKSDHHDDKKHYSNKEDEQQYERGYRDGLYNSSYHNYDRSNAYSDGYRAGVDQRNANVSDHHNRGGYDHAAKYSDLKGDRAAGAMSELSSRGFRQVDNFTSGNTRYSIQWRSQSRQCLQVTIADGKVYDIRDIHTNPHCR